MNKFVSITVAMAVAVLCSARIAAAQPVAEPNNGPSRTATSDSLLVPPKEYGPVVVRACFEFHDVNEINDEHQTFEFTGVLTLRWHDKRQAFDPAAVGVDEKVYQGAYQVDEISPGWFPQLVLVNGSGSYEKQGSVLRVQPDGTLTLTEKVVATAKTEFNFFRFPFDRQRLEAVFELLGFDNSQVVLQVEPETTDLARSEIRIPQWSITGISMSTQDRPASYAGHRGVASALVVRVDVQRQSLYVSRLVTLPLILIVLLSFAVFWMDRSSLGDRISVSFIGILTVVAYQLVMSEILPRIASITWMNGFLNISFLTMVGAVLVNLWVGALDQRGRSDVADRVDRRCRWIFPLIYFSLILLASGVAFLTV